MKRFINKVFLLKDKIDNVLFIISNAPVSRLLKDFYLHAILIVQIVKFIGYPIGILLANKGMSGFTSDTLFYRVLNVFLVSN